jgi:hypothetical protein
LKVVVVGLLRKQVSALRGEFPALSIEYLSKEDKTGVASAPLIKSADRVVMMIKFIEHTMYNRVPKSKLIHINGGLTALRGTLATLEMTAKMEAIANAPTDALITEEMDMPTGKPLMDFSCFKTCATGDIIEFTRPSGMAAHQFPVNISAGRSYAKRNFGVVTEQEIKGSKATVRVVVGYDDAQTAKATAEGRTPTTATIHTLPVSVMKQGNAETTGTFWMQVYIEHMKQNPAGEAATHARAASLAVDMWEAKFNAPAQAQEAHKASAAR